MKKFSPGSITGLVTAIVALALTPSLAFMIYSGYSGAQSNIVEAKATALRSVRHIARQQAILVNSARAMMLTLSNLAEIESKKPEECAFLLHDLALRDPVYTEIRLCDPEGNTLAASTPDAAELSAEMRNHIRVAAGGNAFTLHALSRDNDDAPSLACLYPVRRHGQTTSVLLALLRISVPEPDLAMLQANHASCLQIADRRGSPVFSHAFTDSDTSPACAQGDAWEKQSSSPLRHGLLQNNNEHYVAFEKLFLEEEDTPSLSVSLLIPTSIAAFRIRDRVITNFALLSGAICLAFAVTWKLYDIGVRTPIGKMLTVAGLIKEGLLGASFAKNDFIAQELNILADALNTMVHSLEQRNRELIAARDEVSAAGRMKSEFLANLSHEIRTPMNAILGMSYLAKNSELQEEQVRYLDAIQEEANKLLAMINDILDLSKIEAAAVSIENVPFSLSEVLHKVLREAEGESQKKSVVFSVFGAETVPESLLNGDPLRLSHVLSTLLTHAVTHSTQVILRITCSPEENGRATIVMHFAINVHAGDEEANKGFAKSLKNGIMGLHEQRQGLHLAIAHNVVSLMRGKLEIQNTSGVGVLIAIRLPFSRVETKSLAPSRREEPKTDDAGDAMPAADTNFSMDIKNIRVLLVEDNRINQQIIKEGLTNAGASVRTASNGFEALALLDDTFGEIPYHVVLMDLQMPELDGAATTRRLRMKERLKTLPVIAMSAHDVSGEWRQYREAGINDYVIKPIHMPSLIHLIGKWTRSSG
ncbi:MAG: response regulator [Desulfovibrio sp.]|jgi:signal transduction histidine kinase/ActR/RegA family two-component response regulator|nr:response regulator [Desulfovibrio sp.]